MQEITRILLVDICDTDSQALHGSLSHQPLTIDRADTVGAARDLLRTTNYDAIFLQSGLDDIDGLNFIRETNVPVILASLPANDEQIMSAYTAGVADFICGPVSEVEMITRLQSLLNKRQPETGGRIYNLGDIRFDSDQRQWIANGKFVHLSRHETAFLVALLDSPRYFCTYAQLLSKIWGPSQTVETQNLRVLAGQLRRKIEPSTGKATLLLTVPGVGYKIALEQIPKLPVENSGEKKNRKKRKN